MKPSAGAGRPSCLAVNPRNREASAARRVKLLAAFDALDEDTRADFLEAAETMALSSTPGGVDNVRAHARTILRRLYAAAGWDQAGTDRQTYEDPNCGSTRPHAVHIHSPIGGLDINCPGVKTPG
jgi:hypothetical protein